MNKPILKYMLIKMEKALVFQILEQRKIEPFIFEASNGFDIDLESGAPSIHSTPQVLYLCEDSKFHWLHDISIKEFRSNSARDDYFDKTQVALKEFVEHIEKEEKEETVAENQFGVYEL